MPPVVQLRGVVKTYRDGQARFEALRGVDLDVGAGEFAAVTGPSGSGKSTLLHIIAGLERPDAGSAAVAGRDLRRMSETELALLRRRHIGIVFQFFHLLGHLTVRQNIALPALIAGTPAKAARRRVEALAEELDITGLLDKTPAQLSGGERQRAAIARAVIHEPTILLADEPTGNLDEQAAGLALAALRRLHAAGLTILLVTHDEGVAACAGRRIRLEAGKAVACGESA